MRVGIVGAGISGLSCAQQLAELGIASVLFDKGRRPGGRLSTLTLGEQAWDFGAQFFRTRSPRFAAQAARWEAEGKVAPWTSGPEGALVGIPSMGALIEAMAQVQDVQFGAQVQRIERTGAEWQVSGPQLSAGPFAALVIAVPAEQAAALLSLHDLAMAQEAAAIRSTPCWSLMASFAEPLPELPNLLRDSGPIAWAARNASKPGRPAGECWVVQADARWSKVYLEDNAEAVAARLLQAFAHEVGRALPAPSFAKAHRWRYALPYGQRGAPQWNAQLRLGACGDWCVGPMIEGAWLSGYRLAEDIARALQPASAPTGAKTVSSQRATG